MKRASLGRGGDSAASTTALGAASGSRTKRATIPSGSEATANATTNTTV
jgi:hypothetical protein